MTCTPVNALLNVSILYFSLVTIVTITTLVKTVLKEALKWRFKLLLAFVKSKILHFHILIDKFNMANETKEYFNISNSTANFQVDYFEGLYENRPSKIAAVAFSIIAAIIILPLVYFIIWFEKYGSDQKRTFLNKMVSSLCWTCIEWFAIIQSIDTIRYFSGPLPESICLFQLHFRFAIFCQLMIIFDVIAVGRYVFIFHLKNPAAFHDDFWSRFINIWILISCACTQIYMAKLPGCSTVYYYLCTGRNPVLDQHIARQEHTYVSILFIVTAILHIFIGLKIHLYKKSAISQTTKTVASKYQKSQENLANLAINAFLVLSLLLIVLLSGKLNRMGAKDYNCHPNYLYEYFFRMASPHLFCFFVVVLHYYRCPGLVAALKMTLNDFRNAVTITN